MWEKRVEPNSGTAHVAKCFPKWDQSWFTQVLLDDGPSFFFLKVSKIFHKSANFFSVYIFLSLTNHKSKMCEVISWLLCFWFELLEKSQKLTFFLFFWIFRVTYQQQFKTKIMLMMAFSINLASKHTFKKISSRIFDFWFLRHRKMKTADFCSLVKGFGNF